MKRTLFLICMAALAVFFMSSCEKPYCYQVNYVYAGFQEETGFSMAIDFYYDTSRPVRVRTGRNYFYVPQEADEEYLICRYTDDGFELCDQKTGQVRYSATNLDNFDMASKILIKWSHSPGPIWDKYAEANNWPREMVLFWGIPREG